MHAREYAEKLAEMMVGRAGMVASRIIEDEDVITVHMLRDGDPDETQAASCSLVKSSPHAFASPVEAKAEEFERYILRSD